MGWFDEQIRQRMAGDEERFNDAFDGMAGIVMGRQAMAGITRSREKKAVDAIGEVLRYYQVRQHPLPESVKDINEQLEYLLRPSGVMRRTVRLTEGWYKDCIGALLCTTVNGCVVAALPRPAGGYSYYDYDTGERVVLNARTAENLSQEAVCFYRPLPLKRLTIPDLFRYMVRCLSVADFVFIGVMTLAVTLVGMLLPGINSLLFDKVLPSGDVSLLAPISCLLIGTTVSYQLVTVAKAMLMERVNAKTNLAVEAAAMMRTLSMPANFFKDYSAGELSTRVNSVQSLFSMLSEAVLTTGLTSVFSLAYVAQIFRYAPSLVVPQMIVILVTVVVTLAASLVQMKSAEKQMNLSAHESGLVFALISGVQKIKLAGAEKRAFARWAEGYSQTAKLQYMPKPVVKYSGVIVTGVSLIGTIVMYYFASSSGVSVADYMAFNVSSGMIMGAFTALTGVVTTVANIRPVMKLVEPILQTVPEISEDKRMVTRLSGAVELNNVSFRYGPETPVVLDDLSLKIRPGQYVAIVGRTGCGKSTLIRLLLGFEKPVKGAVYYDGADIRGLDLKSLRKQIGVVLQDGKLFPGDIYSNITISAPWLTLDDAWAAAETAGVADDIRALPMGMHTLLSGGSGGISGGQAQRLMIARAIAPKPHILIFDEATSALDNITQKQVSEALDALKCTRIVVAHRLSTIRRCGRILVLDGGHIVQDGTYDALIADKAGLFYDLVSRQRIETEEDAPTATPADA